MIIIYEILMVFSVLFCRLNQRPNKIFCCDSEEIFVGLPPVNGAPIYPTYPTMKG